MSETTYTVIITLFGIGCMLVISIYTIKMIFKIMDREKYCTLKLT